MMMTERAVSHAWRVAAAILAASALPLILWQPRLGAGVLVGGAWNLASLGCLMRALSAWLGPTPSRRRAVAWLLVKLGGVYPLAWLLLRHPAVSALGFGIGFSLVLVVILAHVVWAARPAARGTSSAGAPSRVGTSSPARARSPARMVPARSSAQQAFSHGR